MNTRLQRSDKQRKPSRPISRLGVLHGHCALGLATTSLASALQVIWIPTRLAASSRLFVGIGRFRQPSVDLDQYPSDESDQAGKQHEHPSEGHEIQKESHVLSGARATIVSVCVPSLYLRAGDYLDFVALPPCPIAELASPIKDQRFGTTGAWCSERQYS